MPMNEGFPTFLACRITQGNRLRVHHVSTPPVTCPPLFASAPDQIAEETWCESHFLTFSQNLVGDSGTGPPVLVLGLEVLIFITENVTTIFVSKADSTGFLHRQPDSSKGSSVALTVTSAFLEFLVLHRLTESRLVLSLFARSQNQYLFPGSIENESKRILDDRQLIKWWCRVLDPIIRATSLQADGIPAPDAKAYVVVPGCEKAETKAFFPPSARLDEPGTSKWLNQYPASLLAADESAPLRCLIPRLPDDPKARFLEDLDGAQVNVDGSWKGVKTLDQFWEMMSYRQECSAGRVVGFIWVIFNPSERRQSQLLTTSEIDSNNSVTETRETTFAHNVTAAKIPSRSLTSNSTQKDKIVMIADEVHPIVDGAGQDRRSKSPDVSKVAKPPAWPSSTRGQLILANQQYSSLMDHLLQLDFSGVDNAEKSTKDWIDRAKDAVDASVFGVDVEGIYVPSQADRPAPIALPVTNMLMGVRKKRKAEPATVMVAANEASVNVMSLDSVRKKPKSVIMESSSRPGDD